MLAFQTQRVMDEFEPLEAFEPLVRHLTKYFVYSVVYGRLEASDFSILTPSPANKGDSNLPRYIGGKHD